MVHPRSDHMNPRAGVARPRRAALAAAAVIALATALGFAAPATLEAQGGGQVIGQVTDQATGRPLVQVQVYLAGTGLGTLTRGDGRFLILNVPPGNYTLTAERIGMRTATAQITVEEDQSTTADLALEEEALGLDEIVVTGTAGQARRREVGTSVAQVDVATLADPVPAVDQLLSARAPGVVAVRTSGMSGSGSQIRLRGNVSVAMSNQPLVYVDGVRIRSDGLALNHAVGQHVAFGPKDVMGPLNDINPSDIERIEIVKGPAATALYGTEAAGGVIQIFTKRGSGGDAQWSAQIDQGVNWVQEFGPPNAPYMRLDPWLRNGHQQRYSLSVRGGTESISYYVSGSMDNNEGILPNDADQKYLGRINLGFQPRGDLDIQVNTSITRQHVENSPSGSSPYSISHNGYKRAPARQAHATYVRTWEEDVIWRLLDYEIDTDVDRVVAGITTTYTPMPRFTNRLTLGLDRLASDMRNIRPFGYVNDPTGSVSDRNWTAEQLTADYVGSFDLRLTESFRTSISWGGQSIVARDTDLGASTNTLPGPGEHTVTSGASYQAREARSRVVNAGIFGQTLLDFSDRYFLTLALRIDGNSAFGEDFGLQPYPRATFSWVMSDEGVLAAGPWRDEGPGRLGTRGTRPRGLRRRADLAADSLARPDLLQPAERGQQGPGTRAHHRTRGRHRRRLHGRAPENRVHLLRPGNPRRAHSGAAGPEPRLHGLAAAQRGRVVKQGHRTRRERHGAAEPCAQLGPGGHALHQQERGGGSRRQRRIPCQRRRMARGGTTRFRPSATTG